MIGGEAGPCLAAKMTAVFGNPCSGAVPLVVATLVGIPTVTAISAKGVVDDNDEIDGESVERWAAGRMAAEPTFVLGET